MKVEKASEHLAQNVRRLREVCGLTQAQLAAKAEIPRATLSLLESGSANPTLTVLLSVSQALSVRPEELLELPPSETLHVRRCDIVTRTRGMSQVRNLLPQGLQGVELDEMLIPAGQTLVGAPHTVGTREYLIVQSGRLTLYLEGEVHDVRAGDVVVFRGHQKHSYSNVSRRDVCALSVIARSFGD